MPLMVIRSAATIEDTAVSAMLSACSAKPQSSSFSR